MGLCTPAERAEVEKLVAQYPELVAELSAIEQSLEELAFACATEPPVHLKDKVLAAITDTRREGRVVDLHSSSTSKVVNETRFNWLAAASIALLIGSGAANVFLYNEYNDANQRIIALQTESSTLASDVEITKTSLSEAQGMLAFMSDTATAKITMGGLAISPQSKATVYWNKQSSQVYLAVNSLPMPAQNHQYQLWAIVDGAPVDAGVFEVTDTMQKMKTFTAPQAFAVTLEKMGGSAAPTMELMYVVGNV